MGQVYACSRHACHIARTHGWSFLGAKNNHASASSRWWPSPANAADASQLANGALCAPSDQKFGEERDTADPDKGIATYVGGDMYVGRNPSTGVDAEGNITLSSSNAPDGSYAAGAEGLTVINGKLAMNPIKSLLWNDAATESNHNVNGGGGRRGPV